jgi:carbon monoxide dehydrogenase subunit G
MKLQGTHLVRASQAQVFAGICNPNILASCISNIKSIEPESESVCKVVLEVSVGVVQGTLKGKIKFLNLQPNQSLWLKAEIQTPVGRVSATGEIVLTARRLEGKHVTEVSWSTKSPFGVLVAILGYCAGSSTVSSRVVFL